MTTPKKYNLPADLMEKILNEESEAAALRMIQRYDEQEALGEKGRELEALQLEAEELSKALTPLLFDTMKNASQIKPLERRLAEIQARVNELTGFEAHRVQTPMVSSFGPLGNRRTPYGGS